MAHSIGHVGPYKSKKYNKKESNLENITFNLYKGQTIGIIGATGSGKTTIINLLMRFYDPSSGSIKIYGKNIKDLKQNEHRKRIGVVFQNDLIFADSIYGNIQFNRDHITDKDIEIATQIAQADFILDKENQTLMYLSYSTKETSGSFKHSLSTVPLYGTKAYQTRVSVDN